MKKYGKLDLRNCDCMELMREAPDNAWDLAICDPPYGIARFGDRIDDSCRIAQSKINEWDKKPNQAFFKEVFRVSRNQIIWGANNFQLPPTEYFCIWNKKQTVDNFASAEYAWVSMGLKAPAKVFEYSIHQEMATRRSTGGKIHPTQKPVALYRWLLQNYAKEGDKILDTHGGSMSIAIACGEMKYDLTLSELDEDYFNAGVERVKRHFEQQDMFYDQPKLIVNGKEV